MPGSAVGIGLSIGRCRQRAVGSPPVGRGRRSIDRRPDEWVLEANPRVDLQQLLVDGGFCGARVDPKGARGMPEQRDVPGGLGGCQQHQLPGHVRQRSDTPEVVVLDLLRQISCIGKREAARQLGCAHAPWELQQRQRVAAGFGHDPIPDTIVEPARRDRRQQRAGMLVVKARDPQVPQALEVARFVRLASREDDRHRLREQPSRNESED